MAPRRSVKISTVDKKISATSDNFPRTRRKNASPLKVPSVITISIPVNKSSLDVPDTEKKVDTKTKMALADEVARAQLLKETIAVRVPPPKNTRTRKKIVVSNPVSVKQGPVKEEKSPVATTSKISNKKTALVKIPPPKKGLTRKRLADSTLEKSQMKRQKTDLKPDPEKEKVNLLIVSAHNMRLRGKQASADALESVMQSTPGTLCAKSPVSLKVGSEHTKTKSTNIKSPKLKLVDMKSSEKVSNVEAPKQKLLLMRSPKVHDKPVPSENETGTSKICNTVPVNSRQNSISSTSNFSWTRDISMSSTTTCVTVSSNDFVSINKKLPLIKLNNIGSELDKYKPKSAVSDESSSSDSSSTSDSETSSDQQLTYSSLSAPAYTSPLNVNSLNLSISSRHSIAETPIEEHKVIKPDYGKAAEKLKQVLNKIDIELTNWISDTEYGISESAKIRDNLLTILTNEFCSFKHCRNLQNLLKADKIGDLHCNNEVAPENYEKGNEKTETKIISMGLSKTIQNQVIPKDNNRDNHNTENDAPANKSPDSSQLRNNIKFSAEKNPPQCNKNENNTVASSHSFVKHDQITTNRADSEEIFTRPSTSGGKTLTRRESESDSSSFNSDTIEDVDVHEPVQNGHDDDDALSLFAESITGIESSKLNASVMSGPVEKTIEEYVPYPIQKNIVSPPNYSYCPTKIADQVKNGVVKIVCEKQNADSTSISKGTNRVPLEYNETVSVANSVESNQEVNIQPTIIEENISCNVNKPLLIGQMYRLTTREESVVFRGFCYYNLMHRCSSTLYGKQCRYSHEIPDQKLINSRLAKLNDEALIKQYIIIRKNDNIMRRFGICVLLECEKRKLTRVIVEIAYDFIVTEAKGTFTNEKLKTLVVEIVLLHLNTVDLSVCEDLLKLRIGDLLLCEALMQTMTRTQNFSRFKSVFLNLTYFLVNNDRTFSLEVAEQILERVCILPFDEPVVRALIQIMRLSPPEIFLNSMIKHFEQLIRTRTDIFNEYSLVKKEVNFEKLARSVVDKRPAFQVVDQRVSQQAELLRHPVVQPLIATPVDQSLMDLSADQPLNVRSEMREGVPLPPSPDTTHLDTMNKMAEDTVTPKATRTVVARTELNSSSHSQMGGFTPVFSAKENVRYKNWQHRSIFQQIPRDSMRPFRGLVRPNYRQIRKPQPNQRLVTFGGSPVFHPPPGQHF